MSTSNTDELMISLAKRLADNDIKIRKAAIKDLKLKVIASFDEQIGHVEMMKLWKGLFYCMWASDKMPIQQQLADKMASFLLLFKSAAISLSYLECFWKTMMREWTGLDYWRMDKFYFLCRKFMVYSGDFLAMHNFDMSIVEQFNKIMAEYPLSTEPGKIPASIQYHVCENYAHLFMGNDGALNPAPSVAVKAALFGPVLDLILNTREKVTLQKVNTGFIATILSEDSEQAWSEEELLEVAKLMIIKISDESLPEVNVARVLRTVQLFSGRLPQLSDENVKETSECCVSEKCSAEKCARKVRFSEENDVKLFKKTSTIERPSFKVHDEIELQGSVKSEPRKRSRVKTSIRVFEKLAEPVVTKKARKTAADFM